MWITSYHGIDISKSIPCYTTDECKDRENDQNDGGGGRHFGLEGALLLFGWLCWISGSRSVVMLRV